MHGTDFIFLNPNIKNLQSIRFNIIKNLKKKGIKCFTGSCPEIYLEKSFQNLEKNKLKRLKNCKNLGLRSLALDVNHTLTHNDHKEELNKLKFILDKFLSKSNF